MPAIPNAMQPWLPPPEPDRCTQTLTPNPLQPLADETLTESENPLELGAPPEAEQLPVANAAAGLALTPRAATVAASTASRVQRALLHDNLHLVWLPGKCPATQRPYLEGS